MDIDIANQILPKGPTGLSFEKDVFMKDDFDVDVFVMKYKRSVNLETLRDDLHIYLKILHSAMIELINKDYADFVNLSTNLVGMDKAIRNITVPLGQLKEEILSVKSSMSSAITTMQEKLKERQELREKREALQRLVNITHSVDNIERLLKVQRSDSTDQSAGLAQLGGKLIERVATEFNKLQFYVTKSGAHPIVESVKPRIATITTTLQFSLEGAFLGGLEAGNEDILRQCLRTYALIDKTTEAEKLFSQHIVLPAVKQMISEQVVKTGSDGLGSMYKRILEFVPTHCQILNDVTTPRDHADGIHGYDFAVNAVWPVVVNVIDTQASSIYAPGNPAVFHQRYTKTMEFVGQFEQLCGSQRSIEALRAHPSYSSFISKWSLPVYFQIRFQEIAGSLETALAGPQAFHKSPGADWCSLLVTHVLWTCLCDCWKDEVYLGPLSHRFLKLTFQLISRFAGWLDDIFKKQVSPTSGGKAGDEPAFSDRRADDGGTGVDGGKGDSCAQPSIAMGEIVSLVCDVETLSEKVRLLCDEHVIPRVSQKGFSQFHSLRESFVESRNSILSKLPQYHAHIASEVLGQCAVHVKQVNDIPRLYRRTNREAPSQASAYVARTMQPVSDHIDRYCGSMDESSKRRFIRNVIVPLTEQYSTLTSDVLTSVKKMEDSLKRLKKARGGQTSGTGTVSDDDKIRRQIVLDLTEFITWIDKFGVRTDVESSVTQLAELASAAESSMA